MQNSKPKLTKGIVKKDVEVFLKAIQTNKNKNFSDIWGLYNSNNGQCKHQSGMHAGHIVFPTYTATDHRILCNTLPDSLLLKQIVCDADLMQKYCEIYTCFLTKIQNGEWQSWNNSFAIDAFKVLLAGHYMAHNIVCLERLSQRKGGIYTYKNGPYNITWKKGTINQHPYNEFLNTLREIDQNEDMLKTIQSYLVKTNGPSGQYENKNFALAAKYFIDELLNANKLRKQNQQPTYNFNMVFNALVCAEINSKKGLKKRETLFQNYLHKYQATYNNIPNNNIYTAVINIINNKWNPSINCVNGTNNNIAKYDTKNLNGLFNQIVK